MPTQIGERGNPTLNEDPFFILYVSRSGSTFLANELTKRFQLLVTPETNFFGHTLRRHRQMSFESQAHLDSLIATIMSDPKFADFKISPEALRAIFERQAPINLSDALWLLIDQYRRQCGLSDHQCGIKQAQFRDVQHYCDLIQLFPSAKFIGLIRDGRAVYHSQKNSINSDKGTPMESNAKKAARRWMTITKLLRELELTYPNVMIVKYENLIRDTSNTMRQIGEFLNVKPSCPTDGLRQYEIPARYGDKLHSNIYKAPQIERITAWQNSLPPSEIAAFESVARDCLVQEGYTPLNTAAARPSWMKWRR